MTLLCRIALIAYLILLLPFNLLAQPFDDIYSVGGINFPDTYGPVSITFDNQLTNVGGMSIGESVAEFQGTLEGLLVNDLNGQELILSTWENCGTIIEFNWNTQNGAFIAGTPRLGIASELSFSELNLSQSFNYIPSGLFITFRRNSLGVATSPDPSLFSDPTLLGIGEHPSEPGTETIFFNVSGTELSAFLSSSQSILSGNFNTEYFGSQIGFLEIAYAFGLLDAVNPLASANQLNGLSVGVFLLKSVRGDFNADGIVSLSDLAYLQSQLGLSGDNLPADLNFDGIVDRSDVALFISNFGASSPCTQAAARSVVQRDPNDLLQILDGANSQKPVKSLLKVSLLKRKFAAFIARAKRKNMKRNEIIRQRPKLVNNKTRK